MFDIPKIASISCVQLLEQTLEVDTVRAQLLEEQQQSYSLREQVKETEASLATADTNFKTALEALEVSSFYITYMLVGEV
jgi:hypothetical protein